MDGIMAKARSKSQNFDSRVLDINKNLGQHPHQTWIELKELIATWNLVAKKRRNQFEVTPVKNLFFQAVLKSDVKDSFGYNNEIESMGKTLTTI